ncbi:NAD(P)/FAD-dependent oxidoreductase [Pseudonocardia spirodelae]|uniref:Lycopene cyclase family protein n=1 Tax=Pseudonocardia spirodelae TaxID=3133431 RepID=A0ABU8T1S8_9PSEU
MRVGIIGSGPAGLLLGAALARRGHTVVAVDPDPGPDAAGDWPRRGVMQFRHPHAVRPQVGEVLRAELPEAWDACLAAGAEPIVFVRDDGTRPPPGLRVRRETFERALRPVAARVPGLTLRCGHVDRVAVTGGRAHGLVVDGETLPADLVVDASGRAGRATRDLGPGPTAGGDTGIAYVSRQYRLHDAADPGPMVNPLAWEAQLDGYQVIVFRHEHGIFSVLLVRPAGELRDLRHEAAFTAACRAVPGLSDWTDPGRAAPLTPVLPGGRLHNHYRPQPGVAGLVLVGDAVCTTTPMFGRGLATTAMQVRALLAGIDAGDLASFGPWCDAHMRPWVLDHVRSDEHWRRVWSGGDLDLDRRVPSDLIAAAAQVDGRIAPALGPYFGMQAGPDSLDPVEPLARAVYRGGWRPPVADGPTRAELAEVLRDAVGARVSS